MIRLTSLLVLLVLTASLQAQTARSLLGEMFAAIEQSRAHAFTMVMEERIDGEMVRSGMDCKVQYSPYRCFIDNTSGPNEGVQVLYVEGERNDKALINKMFGIKLSPFNNLIRADQHNTLLSLGFQTPHAILSDAIRRADERDAFDQVFSYEGTVTFKGRTCHHIEIADPTFAYVNYTIRDGETLFDIAQRKNISEYLIVQANDFRNFNSGKAGETIRIPTSYAKRSTIYIDAQNKLPVYQRMEDDQGLFEIYEYSNVVVNPGFTAADWDEDNEAYDF